MKFQSNYMRLQLPQPVLEEVYKKEKVTEDRAHAIEATVVRIMKSKKSMEFNTLMNEVLASLHMFKPQPPVIKKRIENLITKEFIKRDESDKSLLIYLA